MQQPTKHLDISLEDFVKLWQSSDSQAAVVKALGCSRGSVEHLASRLRKAGVQLKRMSPNPGRKIDAEDVAKLNELCK